MNILRFEKHSIFIFSIILLLVACSNENAGTIHKDQKEKLNEIANPEVKTLMKKFNVIGLGLGFIENGVLVKTEYYGEQSPNFPVTDSTMFNVASITKAITTEVFLRLASEGKVNLDESISEYYVHPDIVDDPRHKILTPRIILTHKTGFRNWPYEYEDGKLAFDNDPNTIFGYSGIGFYILAKYLEEKLTTTFPHLVEETIFRPLNMDNTSIVEEAWLKDKRTTPADKDGKYIEPYDNNIGYWNSADDLHVTVNDYAKFLISSMNNEGLSNNLIAERERIHSELMDDPIFGTPKNSVKDLYPPSYGYGLGWMVFDYGNGNKNIQHGGNDGGENAMGYYHTKTKNGLIVFCNGGNGTFLIPQIVELLDKEQRYTPVYNYILDKFFSN